MYGGWSKQNVCAQHFFCEVHSGSLEKYQEQVQIGQCCFDDDFVQPTRLEYESSVWRVRWTLTHQGAKLGSVATRISLESKCPARRKCLKYNRNRPLLVQESPCAAVIISSSTLREEPSRLRLRMVSAQTRLFGKYGESHTKRNSFYNAQRPTQMVVCMHQHFFQMSPLSGFENVKINCMKLHWRKITSNLL